MEKAIELWPSMAKYRTPIQFPNALSYGPGGAVPAVPPGSCNGFLMPAIWSPAGPLLERTAMETDWGRKCEENELGLTSNRTIYC